MARFLEHVLTAVLTLALVAAGVWFGGPRIVAYVQGSVESGIAAKALAKAEGGALAADTAAATRAQASCSAEVAHALDAAKAISQASAIQHPASAGAPRPMIGADQIRAMMQ